MIRSTPHRRSRRVRRCTTCTGRIPAGSPYLELVASPNHEDLGNQSWWRLAECKPCAVAMGRGDLFAGLDAPEGEMA